MTSLIKRTETFSLSIAVLLGLFTISVSMLHVKHHEVLRILFSFSLIHLGIFAFLRERHLHYRLIYIFFMLNACFYVADLFKPVYTPANQIFMILSGSALFFSAVKDKGLFTFHRSVLGIIALCILFRCFYTAMEMPVTFVLELSAIIPLLLTISLLFRRSFRYYTGLIRTLSLFAVWMLTDLVSGILHFIL
jgi:hypothetical protein